MRSEDQQTHLLQRDSCCTVTRHLVLYMRNVVCCIGAFVEILKDESAYQPTAM